MGSESEVRFRSNSHAVPNYTKITGNITIKLQCNSDISAPVLMQKKERKRASLPVVCCKAIIQIYFDICLSGTEYNCQEKNYPTSVQVARLSVIITIITQNEKAND